MSNHTTIIAEIGECFNGDLAQAQRLIAASAAAGCDYAKFQTLNAEGLSDDDPERDWLLSLVLDRDRLALLRQWCEAVGVGFLCTPEKRSNAEDLLAVGCREAKIASTCLRDQELIDFVADNFPVVFVSTGMASLEEVDAIMARLSGQERVFLMHCVSEYPTGPLLEQRGLRPLAAKDVRLAMMDILRERHPGAVVGYSDHTLGIAAPIAAVARGAGVIEKHLTLDRQTPMERFQAGEHYLGTDHVLSLEPDELFEMVRCIRQVEVMIGEKRWERSEGERLLMDFLHGRFAH